MTTKAFLFRLVLSGHAGYSNRPVPTPKRKLACELVYKPTLLYSKAAQSVRTGGGIALRMANRNVDVPGRNNMCLLHETHLNSDPSPILFHGTDRPTEAGGTAILVIRGLHHYDVLFSDLRHLEATVI